MSKPLIIYHANCMDGFGAAFCAWLKFGDDAEYVPCQYGEDPPNVDGRRVWIVDFSFPRAKLERMAAAAAGLTVLDHHKTAKVDLEGLPFAVFDMGRSGAGMTWDYFNPDQPRAPLIDYIEDRDLWRFELPNSKAVNAWLASHPKDFPLWLGFTNQWDMRIHEWTAEGNAILRAESAHVDFMQQNAMLCEFAGYANIPVINCTSLTSEIVGKLAETALFAVGWFQRKDGRFQYSLRSRPKPVDSVLMADVAFGDSFDVTIVAKQWPGGGGHPSAAGFTADLPVHVFPAMEKAVRS